MAPDKSSGSGRLNISGGRRILLLRHGERVDRVFSSVFRETTWVDKCFVPDNVYKRLDTNLPRFVPLRSTNAALNYDTADYLFDPPLTSVGEGISERLGSRVGLSLYRFTNAYCSPSLRCLQTTTRFLTGMSRSGVDTSKLLPLKCDAGLFDFAGFNEYLFTGMPTFLTPSWLKHRGILVNESYRQSLAPDGVKIGESVPEFYQRIEKALKHILAENTGGNVSLLISSHAPVIDASCQILLKKPQRNDEQLKGVANYLRYVGMLVLEEEKKSGQWRLIPPPVKTFRYGSNELFNWKKMNSKDDEDNDV